MQLPSTAGSQDTALTRQLRVRWSSAWMPDWSCGVAEQASEDPEIAAAHGYSGCLLLPGVLSVVGSPDDVWTHLMSAPFIRRWQGFRPVPEGEELVASTTSFGAIVRTEFRGCSDGALAAVEELERAEPDPEVPTSSSSPPLYRFGPFARERSRALASGVGSIWDESGALGWNEMPASLVDGAARVVLPTLLATRATFGFRTPPARVAITSRVVARALPGCTLEVHRCPHSAELQVVGSPGGSLATVEVDTTS